jgi:hypothetical protein
MLPLDYTRCDPYSPDIHCHNCKRFAHHPEQTWGPRTSLIIGVIPQAANCHYIPAKESEHE